MRKEILWKLVTLMLFTVSIAVGSAGSAWAQTSNSYNYQMTESQFGTTDEGCSSQYCAKTSIGDLSNGNEARTATATFEDIVNNEPSLDVIIGASESNLGTLTPDKTANKVVNVKVRNYLTGGYTLQIIGTPPSIYSHTLKTPITPTASAPGTEQFAINVAANTTPEIGAEPIQVPAGQGTFGLASENYRTPNLFKYESEDVIASSSTDSGRTDYTISMIINVASSTPAGHYASDFMVVVIPGF